MERKTISIDITPEALKEEYIEQAGTMWEHNATNIVFNIDDSYIGDNYRYYIEYRSLIGTKDRTDFLTLSGKTVSYTIPAVMTSMRSVECHFNIIAVDGNGDTLQVIKPVKFCLDFDFAEDTDGSIVKENNFTVNLLLEAIRNNAFKGEKGDKGDSYVLTEDDKVEVAEKISEDVYGLPYTREFHGQGIKKLVGVSDNGKVLTLKVMSPVLDFSSVGESSPVVPETMQYGKIYFGENLLEHLLTPEAYKEYYHDSDIYTTNYFVTPIFAKPNTKYVLVRLNKKINNIYSGIKTKEGTMTFFAYVDNEAQQRDQYFFTTGESGIFYIISTQVGLASFIYENILNTTFSGIGVYEASSFVATAFQADTPMISISDDNADTADITNGTVTRNIVQYELPSSFEESEITSYTGTGKTIYRYRLPITEIPALEKRYNIASTHYKTVDVPVESDDDVSKLLAVSADGSGVYFDRENEQIYLYSTRDSNDLTSFWTSEKEAERTPTVYYRKRTSTEEIGASIIPKINKTHKKINPAPINARWDLTVNGCISDVLNEMMRVIDNMNTEEEK